MSRLGPRPGLSPSLLDRLIDPESGETPWHRGYGYEQMVAAIRRDLEELLNVQLPHGLVPDDFPEVRGSVACYGVPELISLEGRAPRLDAEVARAIREAIERFEPRLREVRVTPIRTPDRPHDARLRFQITAALRVAPAPEVSFVTVVTLTTGEASVQHRGESS